MQGSSRLSSSLAMSTSTSPSMPQGMQSGIPHNAQWIQGPGKTMHHPNITSVNSVPSQQNLKQQFPIQRPQQSQGHIQSVIGPSQQLQSTNSSQDQNPQESQQSWGATHAVPIMQQSQNIIRAQAINNPKNSPAIVTQPSGITPSGNATIVTNNKSSETRNRILSKQRVQDLIAQIDHGEKLEPALEDILVEIAEDFFNSMASFGCSLAKHRKSDTLEPKDILLFLERNWNMSIPGFTGDEYRTYKRPTLNENHKQRLAVVRKSLAASQSGTETGNLKETGQGASTSAGKAQSTKNLQDGAAQATKNLQDGASTHAHEHP
eukprot:TRINITY_DN1322_c0_g1_i1.p1 TRINITY_DN1322_c0_g1~~TRINITY_DN1322_c0_g1_i1.p1  ORF type:complete len:320 (+),score=73.18 TRINITY_DN1322_c0_g1_i1:665-1624(+)